MKYALVWLGLDWESQNLREEDKWWMSEVEESRNDEDMKEWWCRSEDWKIRPQKVNQLHKRRENFD